MTSAPHVCVSCETPLPEQAMYCPKCGAATPTAISLETGIVHESRIGAADEAAQRTRLQAALGEHFRLGELLGRGGFAEVYAATDLQLKRQLAVKVLRSDLVVSPSLAERFRREAESVAKLRHPNIVAIYAVGEAEGLSYYVMPLIEGQSLRERLAEGPLSIPDTRRVLREVAGALELAHKAGIVHRDIKPDNIMLEGDDARVVVMDFGIAKALATGETGLTGTGMIVGTPHYMSPEQASGQKEIDARSDLYSLGVVGYQMLTGRLPFQGDSAQEVLVQQITAQPEPLEKARPDLPDDLLDAVTRCLAKKPEARWQSAADLAHSLEVTEPTGEVSRQAPSWRIRLRRRRLRVPRWRVLAGVLVAMVAFVGVFRRDLFWRAFFHWRGVVSWTTPRAVPARAQAPEALATVVAHAVQLISLGGSAIAVLEEGTAGFALATFDGRTWTRVLVPGAGASAAAVAVGETLLVFEQRVDGPRSTGGGVASWALVRGRFVPADSVPFPPTYSWSDGHQAVVAGSRGALAWRRPSGWELQPSARRVAVAGFFGARREHLLALGYFAGGSTVRPDSILVYRGIAWQSIDPRPDSSVLWVYNAGLELEDGATVIVGRSCTVGTDCRPLIAVQDSPGGRWAMAALSLPAGLDLWGVWGRRKDDLLVWGRHRGAGASGCDSLPTCLYAVSGDRTVAVTDVAGLAVKGVVSLRGAPIVLLEDGTLWTRQDGVWGYLSEVPGTAWTDMSYAEDGRIQTFAFAGDGKLRVAFALDGGGGYRTASYPFDRPVGFRRVLATLRGAYFVTDDGRLLEMTCAGAVGPRCAPHVLAPPGRAYVTDIAGLEGDTLLVVGRRGFASLLRGSTWTAVGLPSGAGQEDFVRVAAGGGVLPTILGTRGVLSRGSDGHWTAAATLPDWLQPAEYLAVFRDSAAAVASRSRLGFLHLRAGAVVESPRCWWWPSSMGEITGLRVIPDGRMLVTTAVPSDPLQGGGLGVYGGAGNNHGDRCAPAWMPRRADLYWVGFSLSGRHVFAEGSGWFSATWSLSALPFAPETTKAR